MNVPFLDLSAAHDELAVELEETACRVLRRGQYVRGRELAAFEAEFATYCESRHAVGVGSGLDALRLALLALGIGSGDEVIVPSHTSIATWLAITHTGARPVPAEPLDDTMCVDPAQVAAAIGPRTAAIVVVHLYGQPADVSPIAALAAKHGLALVEDASQSHGARYHGRRVGSLGDVAAFSLYPTKNLGATGDGGIVVCDDERLVERVRMLGNYGERRRHYTEVCGYNSRLDEIQAALLRVHLRVLDARNARRRILAAQYLDSLSDCAGILLPQVPPYAEPVWHQFVVRVAQRERIRVELGRRGVETLVHYPIAPHRSAAYAAQQHCLPLATRLSETVLSLPISPHLDAAACAHVCEALRSTVRSIEVHAGGGALSVAIGGGGGIRTHETPHDA